MITTDIILHRIKNIVPNIFTQKNRESVCSLSEE